MNFLAHLYLADPDPKSWIGNLLPDLCKPWQWQHLSTEYQHGALRHQQVDRLTDKHPLFIALKQTVSSERRRFAGIILDVCLDHYLARHWRDHHPQSLNVFVQTLEPHFLNPPRQLPEAARTVLQRMMQQQWLLSYSHLDGIAQAFNGLSRRMRFSRCRTGTGSSA
ncbi:ACP phosphodiesterase [Gynuella sp.]|uniref:acyl carrier protein phosphodiesterase n=1 Tax=Gynuella sp. TaxID=2969146 RepID=UPI003D0A9A12